MNKMYAPVANFLLSFILSEWEEDAVDILSSLKSLSQRLFTHFNLNTRFGSTDIATKERIVSRGIHSYYELDLRILFFPNLSWY